jgi:hypothetical protein
MFHSPAELGWRPALKASGWKVQKAMKNTVVEISGAGSRSRTAKQSPPWMSFENPDARLGAGIAVEREMGFVD